MFKGWVNQKNFNKLNILDEITCNNIVICRRRKALKHLIKKEPDGSYSVLIATDLDFRDKTYHGDSGE